MAFWEVLWLVQEGKRRPLEEVATIKPQLPLSAATLVCPLARMPAAVIQTIPYHFTSQQQADMIQAPCSLELALPPHHPTCPHGEHQQSQHSPPQVNQLVKRNQMNQCAIQPQLVTRIYKEVHILLTLIFLPLVIYMLGLTPDARQRVILIEIWKDTSNSMVLIRQPQLHYSEIWGMNFHLSVTRMDWWHWTGSIWTISTQSWVEGGNAVKKPLAPLSRSMLKWYNPW